MPNTPVLNSRVYDYLKYLAQILLPASGALYFGLSGVWGLPNSDEVVGTITVVDAFLGALLGLSSKSYNNSDAKYNGSIDVENVDGSKVFSLNLDGDPDNLENLDEVTFKIKK
jgi:hypothetical protein